MPNTSLPSKPIEHTTDSSSLENRFVIEEYIALKTEIRDRSTRAAKLQGILLTSSIVYLTTIFIPGRISRSESLVAEITGPFGGNIQQPLFAIYLSLIIILPLIGFAIEAMITAEEDAVRRAGVYIRDNIERKIRLTGYRGWEDWLERQDKATKRRTSERIAKGSRQGIILLYCITSAVILWFFLYSVFDKNGLYATLSALLLLLLYFAAGSFLLRKLQETEIVELSSTRYNTVIIDIDGCLADSKRNISTRSKQAIQEIQKQGILVIFATGRTHYGTKRILGDLAANGWHAVSNGAGIVNWPNEQVRHLNHIEPYALSDLVEKLNSQEIKWAAFGGKKIYCRKNHLKNLKNELDNRKDFDQANNQIHSIENTANWDWNSIDDKISKVWCLIDIADSETSMNVENIETNSLTSSRTTDETIEFFHKDANKQNAVEAIFRHLDIDRNSKKVLVLGDNDNDLEIMAWGDHALAPSNASLNVKSLDTVDEFNTSNDEEFVAEALKSYFSLNI